MENEPFNHHSALKSHTPHEKNTQTQTQARARQRQAIKAKQRKAAARKQTVASQQGKKKELVLEMYRTIRLHFPELFDWMREVDDCRKKASDYELAAHLTACLAMFLFKAGSRNQYNQYREDIQFQKNYKRLFGFAMPHGDSVQNVMALLDVDQIERLKQKMVRVLLRRKTFHGSRYRGRWFRIAVDASGVGGYDHRRDAQCLSRTSKTGKTTYFHSVLEARLVTPNGFSVSIATEWIENPGGGEYDKQDCERKGFARLAAALKEVYPRLPMLILADGLYPYEGFLAICQANRWACCVTFKDGNLPTVWREVSQTGRLRWKIENEGFNTLKNGGYGMEHQHARKSYLALKNYFQFMQMAHIIHQLMTLNTRFQEGFMTAKNHPTLKNLWLDLVAAMQWLELDGQELECIDGARRQFRFAA